MGDIFICHTLYHVLIALVRALRSRPGKSTLVLSTCVPEAETLRAKLLDAAPDLWDAVLIVDEEKLEAQNSESDFYRLRHPFRKPYFTLPKGHVYISNDWSALGRYLQRERRVYTLCEDTFGGTLDPETGKPKYYGRFNQGDRKSTRLNSSHDRQPRMPSSA